MRLRDRLYDRLVIPVWHVFGFEFCIFCGWTRRPLTRDVCSRCSVFAENLPDGISYAEARAIYDGQVGA